MVPANDTQPDPHAAARVTQEAREAAERARHVWTGAKWAEGRDLRDVAKLVRGELKALGYVARVTLSRYSMGQRLRVVLTAPAGLPLVNVEWLHQEADPLHTGPMANRRHPRADALVLVIETLCQAYNRSWSDKGQSFHLDVVFADGVEQAERDALRRSLSLA